MTWYCVPRDVPMAFEDVVTVHAYGGVINPIGQRVSHIWIKLLSDTVNVLRDEVASVADMVTVVTEVNLHIIFYPKLKVQFCSIM